MTKSEFIVIHNARITADINNSYFVCGRIHDTHLAGARLLKKFGGGMIKFTTESIGSNKWPTITNVPVAELERIRNKINADRSAMSCAELNLVFKGGELINVFVTEHHAD